MSSKDIAIKVENISKVYRIGAKEELHDCFGGALFDFLKSPLKNYRKYRSLYRFDDIRPKSGPHSSSDPSDIIWALRDISFDVRQGEAVGIIGTNGAGKSTLLKILSRITNPTSGRIEIRGRTSSLLEVGTGFHKELTGRENVYLNGTILGMRKTEVDLKFDEIVAFSGIEKFIDTPVKRYSSGMTVRLAFSVAAHLEPEILIVDEVLAVGDARFQKKCLNKMEDVGKEGRTVLFVSHNMQAITRLCQRAILLDEGKVIYNGPSYESVNAYLHSETGTPTVREWYNSANAPGDNVARLRAVRVRTQNGQAAEAMDIRKPVGIEMEYELFESGYVLMPNFNLYNQEGVRVFVAIDQDAAWQRRPRPTGRYVSTAWIPGNFLSEGIMTIGVAIITLDPVVTRVSERDAVAFQVVDAAEGDSARGYWGGAMPGIVRPLLKWDTQFTPDGSKAPITANQKTRP
ncbi:MAG: ATP-binding cassette domain-containing protein [Desulfobacteraceae bacterium]|nr:ATP-binding cassette domain-containing protein [Desulfobacteraceae bacterium]